MTRYILIFFATLTLLSISATDLRLRPVRSEQTPHFTNRLSTYLYSEADSLTNELQDKYSGEYSYNEDTLESVLIKELFENEWREIENYLYQYDETRILEEIYQVYDNGWINYQQKLYTYNEENIITTYELKYWVENLWNPYLQIDYIYDEEWFLIREEWTYFTTRENNIIYKVEYVYNLEERITTELWSYSADGVTWINYSQGIYQRDEAGFLVNELWQNYFADVWYDYSQYNYTYNEALLLEHIAGFLMGENGWVNYSDVAYEYTEDYYTSLLVSKLWSVEESAWMNNYQYQYTYEEIVSNDVQEVTKPHLQVMLYPNPLQTSVKYSANQLLQKVEVFNLKGQKVYSTKLSSSKGVLLDLDISSLANGIYLFRFEDNQGNVNTLKQVKLKQNLSHEDFYTNRKKKEEELATENTEREREEEVYLLLLVAQIPYPSYCVSDADSPKYLLPEVLLRKEQQL